MSFASHLPVRSFQSRSSQISLRSYAVTPSTPVSQKVLKVSALTLLEEVVHTSFCKCTVSLLEDHRPSLQVQYQFHPFHLDPFSSLFFVHCSLLWRVDPRYLKTSSCTLCTLYSLPNLFFHSPHSLNEKGLRSDSWCSTLLPFYLSITPSSHLTFGLFGVICVQHHSHFSAAPDLSYTVPQFPIRG